MNHTAWKSVSVCFYYFEKIAVCASGMEIHGETEFFCELKVPWKNLQLSLFISIFKSIVIQSTFSDGNEFVGLLGILENVPYLLDIIIKSRLLSQTILAHIFKRFSCSTWMNAYRSIKVI